MDQKTAKPSIHLQTIPWSSLQIGDLLGHGGYGDVYKALWHGTEVAVKQLHLKTLPVHLEEEFNHEAQMMAQCQFLHVIGLYGICTDIGHNGLVMEYMSKGSLHGVLQNIREELSWHFRWTIAIDISKGLTYLHNKNILHRDLKSLNVLLDDAYRAKICDFGLSRIKLESSSSSTKSKAGTVRWRAPETFGRGFKPASSMDIYSFGVVLWEIASRKIPFSDAQDEVTVGIWIKDGEKENIPEDCPSTYSAVIQDCWLAVEKRPVALEVMTRLTAAKPVRAPIPAPNLKKPYIKKSWHFDPQTMPTEREVALSEGKIFQLLDATPKDKRTVVELYQRNSVSGLEVGDVRVIYNKTFNIKFHEHLKTLQQRAGNPVFLPKWPLMSNSVLRQEVYTLFEETCKPFADPDFPDVKIMPGWHGTKQAAIDSIFKTGYSNLATTDSGFFGKGLYSACEANYAYEVYTKNQGSNGALIMNWLAVYSPLPVINNGEFKPRKPGKKPERYGDMCFLTGKGNFGNHDAHFVPVIPKIANGFDYIPCGVNQEYVAREIVIFESAACLPRFLVELRSSAPQPNRLNVLPTQHQPVIQPTLAPQIAAQKTRTDIPLVQNINDAKSNPTEQNNTTAKKVLSLKPSPQKKNKVPQILHTNDDAQLNQQIAKQLTDNQKKSIEPCVDLSKQKIALEWLIERDQLQTFNLLYEEVQNRGKLDGLFAVNCSSFVRELVINNLNWPLLSPSYVKKILELMVKIPFRILRLTHCSLLTNSHLKTIIQNSPSLIELNLSHCTTLPENIGPLLDRCNQLEILNLSKTNIVYITTKFGFGYVKLPSLKRLWVNGCQSLLSIEINSDVVTHFYAKNCSRLNNIKGKILNPYRIEKFISKTGIEYAELISYFPLLLNVSWGNYESDFRCDMARRLSVFFEELTINYIQLSLDKKRSLLQTIELVLSSFITHKKLLFLIIKFLVNVQIDQDEAVKTSSEEILMQLRNMAPDVLLMIRRAVVLEGYSDAFILAEKLFGSVFINDIKVNLEMLKISDVSVRRNAVIALGKSAFLIQYKINNLFYNTNFSQYSRCWNNNSGVFNKQVIEYLMRFLDKETRIRSGCTSKYWSLLHGEFAVSINPNLSQNLQLMKKSFVFFKSMQSGHLVGVKTSYLEDDTVAKDEIFQCDSGGTENTSSSEEDSFLAEGMSKLTTFEKK